MVKKSEKINMILDDLEEYAKDQKFEFIDKLKDLRKNYTLDQIVGLIQLYLLPAYKEECLKEYVESEIERYKIVSKFMDLPDINLNSEQLDHIIQKITEIIKVCNFVF